MKRIRHTIRTLSLSLTLWSSVAFATSSPSVSLEKVSAAVQRHVAEAPAFQKQKLTQHITTLLNKQCKNILGGAAMIQGGVVAPHASLHADADIQVQLQANMVKEIRSVLPERNDHKEIASNILQELGGAAHICKDFVTDIRTSSKK